MRGGNRRSTTRSWNTTALASPHWTEPATAVKLLKTAIDRVPSDEAKQFYGDKLLDLQLEAGHSLGAYQDSAEPERDFTYLARHLSEARSRRPVARAVGVPFTAGAEPVPKDSSTAAALSCLQNSTKRPGRRSPRVLA